MKSKTKKVLAGIGLGAVMCGTGMLAGCSEIGMSADQISQIMEVAQNIDKYIPHLLTRENAVGILKGSIVSFMTNHNNEWNNFTVTMPEDHGDYTYKVYQIDGQKRLFVEEWVEDDQTISISYMQERDYGDVIEVSSSGRKNIINDTNYYTIVKEQMLEQLFWGVSVNDIKETDITATNIDDNGMYHISFIAYDYEDGEYNSQVMYDVIINQDGIITNIKVSVNEMDGGEIAIYGQDIELKYNQLTSSEMQKYIDMINNAN
jgi:hypothetical protein